MFTYTMDEGANKREWRKLKFILFRYVIFVYFNISLKKKKNIENSKQKYKFLHVNVSYIFLLGL